MSVSLKDEETHRLPQELAAITVESMTAAPFFKGTISKALTSKLQSTESYSTVTDFARFLG
jgi:hypothetical protein